MGRRERVCGWWAGGTATGAAPTCVTPEGLLRAAERRPPAADGVIPMISEDFNEWRMLRHAFCSVIRTENLLYAATPYREDASSCEPEPNYGL